MLIRGKLKAVLSKIADKRYVIAEITNKKSIKKENGLVTVSLSTYNENEEIVFKGEVTALINNS
ncbi:TPA: hypothetical protein O2M23_002932 [Staphylococcus aureus]|nr:hypothetical protein [Staphylococcus aureus]HCZ1493961.1 hypothetical protein [Staphylococcus aureus]